MRSCKFEDLTYLFAYYLYDTVGVDMIYSKAQALFKRSYKKV